MINFALATRKYIILKQGCECIFMEEPKNSPTEGELNSDNSISENAKTNVFSDINGATIIDSTKYLEFCRDYFTEQEQPLNYIVLKDNTKLGHVLNRLPHGIIDKGITGIGATTLEILDNTRNSIIVVPTKALAYNKYKDTNSKKGEAYCCYVGSGIGDIKKTPRSSDIQAYILNRGSQVCKFITVADSLGFLIKVLTELSINWSNEYFLLVDEIDTMQEDSAYRPKLENVMDWYFKFPIQNRAVVSATLNSFSNAQMLKEHKTVIQWEHNPQRNINLYYTDFVDDVAKNTINMLLHDTDDKILIAYNSIDGIANIIEQLPQNYKEDIGILCSERSNDKVKIYLDDNTNIISETGHLNKRIVFMTCAYFAGIDIMDKCHLITVSTRLQPFTYLSTNRMAQIAGRCRQGNLSETIIYDIAQPTAEATEEDCAEYQSTLLRKANLFVEVLNSMKRLVKENAELSPLMNFLNYYMSYLSSTKVDKTSYPLRIIRINSITDDFTTAYFNIDALVQKYHLKKTLYSNKDVLREELSKNNDVAYEEVILLPWEHNSESITSIKDNNKILQKSQVEKLKTELLEWVNNGANPSEFNAIQNYTNKKLQLISKTFAHLCYSFPPEWLIDTLVANIEHGKKLRNTINSLVFYALPNGNKFKALLLQKFECSHIIVGMKYDEYRKTVRRWSPAEILQVMKSIFRDLYNSNRPYSPSILREMFEGIFITTKIKGRKIIRGFKTEEYPKLSSYLREDINELEYFILEPLE